MLSNPFIVVSVFLLSLLLLALFFGFVMQRRRRGSKASLASAPDWAQAISKPASAGGERIASVISEQIEDLVKARMQADPMLQDLKIDFGTSADGALEIWIDDQRYEDVNAIPDERIRIMIQEAVAAYNQGES